MTSRQQPARPRIPDRPEYGEGDPGRQLSWAAVERRLEAARYFWIATTRSDGSPHTVPVWAVWLGGRLYFATSPDTLTARNLVRRPSAVAHTDSAVEVVIAHGLASRPQPGSLAATAAAYEAKYGWRLDPRDPGMPFFALAPRRVLAWLAADVRGTSARWDLDVG